MSEHIDISEVEFKMPADVPRVHFSSTIVGEGKAYFIPGELLEDGRSRLVTGVKLSEQERSDIVDALEEFDHLQRIQDTVDTISKLVGSDTTIQTQTGGE